MMLNVAYSTDEGYCKHVAVSMTSLLQNNINVGRTRVFIIENGLKEGSKQKLDEIGKRFDAEVVFLSSNHVCRRIAKYNFPVPSMYARLFLGSVLPDVDKILYLDADTYVEDGVKALYNKDISDYWLAAVQDNAAYYFLQQLGLGKEDRYVNSGVLLINLKKWREDSVEEHIVKFLRSKNGKVSHADQGVINGVCRGHILILEPQYNLMPEMIYLSVKQSNRLYNVHNYYSQDEIDYAKRRPVIIHYLEKFYSRPWKKDCTHPMKDKYLKVLRESDFDSNLDPKGLNCKVRFRKKIYENLPFPVYVLIEKVLDIRRRLL